MIALTFRIALAVVIINVAIIGLFATGLVRFAVRVRQRRHGEHDPY